MAIGDEIEPAVPVDPLERRRDTIRAMVRVAEKLAAGMAADTGIRNLQARAEIEGVVAGLQRALGFLSMPASSARVDPRREE